MWSKKTGRAILIEQININLSNRLIHSREIKWIIFLNLWDLYSSLNIIICPKCKPTPKVDHLKHEIATNT